MGQVVLGHHENPGGIFVQPMDNPGAENPAYPRQVGTVMEKGIHQGSRVIPRPRMDHHPRGFVHHDQMTILVENRQGDGLSLDLQLLRLRKGESDDLILLSTAALPWLSFPLPGPFLFR